MKPFELVEKELSDAVKKEVQEVNKEGTLEIVESDEFEAEIVEKEEFEDVGELALRVEACNVLERSIQNVFGKKKQVDVNQGSPQDGEFEYLRNNETESREEDCEFVMVVARNDLAVIEQPKKTEMEEEEERVCNYYRIQKRLGSGAFGEVYLVEVGMSMQLAMKVLNKTECLSKDPKGTRVLQESEIQLLLSDSPFIVKLYATFPTANRVFFIMEYADLCNFSELLAGQKLSPDDARFYMAEILAALKHLKQSNIAHRDLKCQNVVVYHNGHIKLCDFGLAKQNMSRTARATTACGTHAYMAPEVYQQWYTRLADIWSFGIMAVRMMTGTIPTGNLVGKEVADFWTSFPFPFKLDLPNHPVLVDLVEKLLIPEEDRIDVEDIQNHQFFSTISWDAVEKLKLVPPTPKYSENQNRQTFRIRTLDRCEVFEGEEDPLDDFYLETGELCLWINSERKERKAVKKSSPVKI